MWEAFKHDKRSGAGEGTMTLQRLHDDTIANGGATVNAATLDPITSGWAVGWANGTPTAYVRYDGGYDPDPEGSFAWIVGRLIRNGAHIIGTWYVDSVIHIDSVDTFDSLTDAITACVERGEEATYNLATGETRYVNDYDRYVVRAGLQRRTIES